MKIKILASVITLFLSTTLSAQENIHSYLKLKSDIKNSYSALQKLATDCSSQIARQSYLTQLNQVVIDLHDVDAVNPSSESSKSADQLALIFMSLNNAHAMGIDLNGQINQKLFSDINDDELVHDRIIADPKNKGTENISVSIANIDELGDSDYRLDFDTPTHYVVNRLKDDMICASNDLGNLPQNIYVEGKFAIHVNAGIIKAHDKFTISPLRHAARRIQLIMSDPSNLALGWPVAANVGIQQTGSTGHIQITQMTDITNQSFSSAGKLAPPIALTFIMDGGLLKYNISDVSQGLPGTLIEDQAIYQPTGTEIFPTKSGFDPGYRVAIRSTVQAGDTFNIIYNSNIRNDNDNALAMINFYDKYLGSYIK